MTNGKIIGCTTILTLAMVLAVSAQRPRGAGGPPGQGGPGNMPPPPDGRNMATDLVAEFDLDEDGSLNASELQKALDALPKPPDAETAAAAEWITAYDADGTETLSVEELETGLEDNRPEMPEGSPPGEPPEDHR